SGIQFGYPRPEQFARLVPDAELFWRRPTGAPGINTFGFPGREIAIPKPSNTHRIIFLGDSCTAQGYPQVVEALLNHAHGSPARQFECINMSMVGYSSHQGRVLAGRYGAMFQPDAVIVCYGWNDHWRAYGAPDSRKVVAVPHGKLVAAS